MSVRNKSSGIDDRDTSWNAVARWYDKHVGETGNEHQRSLAIPAVLELLHLTAGEELLDIGCGQGVLAPFIAGAGVRYTGVDASERLIRAARRRHGRQATFLVGDARRLNAVSGFAAGGFDAAVFLLSLQDMDPLDDVLKSAAWALRPGGRLAILMTHPCFQVPRQSGWGWDMERKLQYRRIDRYLTPLAVPMAPHIKGQKGTATRSFHRPLQAYVSVLVACGFSIEAVNEIPGLHAGGRRGDDRQNSEIPLFLGLRAVKRRRE